MSIVRQALRWLSPFASLVAVATLATAAHAADAWPSRPVKLVVAYPPGQSTDIASRYFAAKLTQALGQQVYVENKAGAFGNVGTSYAARQPADGYTLLMGASGTHAMNPALYDNPGFDADKDFEPVVATAIIPMMVSVNPASSINSMADLIQLARSKPDKVDVAMPSVTAKLVLEMLRARNVPLFGVAYKGSGEAMTAVLGNQVPVLIDTVAATRAQFGKVKPLAVTSPKAMGALPDIKSAAEQGLNDFAVTAWNVLMVPAGTPAPVKERLGAEMRKILALPETTKALQDLGFEPAPVMNSAELLAWTRAERQKYGEIIRAAKMKPE
jgi:tripartite-type tricarboxylate transporter receptor subunit TctC